jgi:transposase
MTGRQGVSALSGKEGSSGRTLKTDRLGPLPVVNHFLSRLGLEELLERFVPSAGRPWAVSPAKGILVLLRSILVERDPVYRQAEMVSEFSPACFGLKESEHEALGDDLIGRALDRLYDADRGTLLTEVVAGLPKRFGLEMAEIHNDTTSVKLTGQYRSASGRSIRGRKAPWITYGYSKDHRPDLKQLMVVFSTSSDGGLPVQFRVEDGNRSDSETHIATWNSLKTIAGRADFLYVADSKLCCHDAMEHIHKNKGRFVTVMPRNRSEDKHFRKRIQKEEPDWEMVWDLPNPRGSDKPRDTWKVWVDPLTSKENWPVVWVYSTLLSHHQSRIRGEHIQKAEEELKDLKARLLSKRAKRRSRFRVWMEAWEVLTRLRVTEYLKMQLKNEPYYIFRQIGRGRPGPETQYRKITKKQWHLSWEMDQKKIDYDKKSDGMYPLLTNDKKLSPRQVLEAHKRQPALEKRFEQLKSVHEIAPVFLKNEGRIEALFTVYFLALLVQALIEREIRRAMKKETIESLPLYGENRASRRPTALQALRLFSSIELHTLWKEEGIEDVFLPDLTDLQKLVLKLLGVPESAYKS